MGIRDAAKSECKWGHLFTDDNIYWGKSPSGGPSRQCRECRRRRAVAVEARRTEKRHAAGGYRKNRPLLERVGEIQGAPDACWEWPTGTEYGTVWANLDQRGMRPWPAHRAVYLTLVGSLPADLVIDHLCRNTRCVNPAHMEPVTNRENVLRGIGPTSRLARGVTV